MIQLENRKAKEEESETSECEYSEPSVREKEIIGKAPPPLEFTMLILDSKQHITNLFEFEDLLGKGSFASVYACRERKTGRIFAIKVLKKS